MPPARRKSAIPKKGLSSRQLEIHQGTKPATNPGAMTRKTADPNDCQHLPNHVPMKTNPFARAQWKLAHGS
jgi:hypothetical protein